MRAKIISALVSFAFATSAIGAGKKFYCTNVGGEQEWSISVDLDKSTAGFFDNDSWVDVPWVDTKVLESFPPQPLHTFEGPDTGSKKGDRLRIVFNERQLTAHVELLGNDGSTKIHYAEDGCEAEET